jgi:serine/threonine protein kinase
MTSPSTPSETLPGKIAGRYRVEKLLGRGGFGAVYRAEDELEERPVALKVIRNDASLDPRSSRSQEASSVSRFSSVARPRTVTRAFGSTPSTGDDVTEAFKDEFRLLTQLHHPNLASVYEFGRCDEAEGVFFTQELVEGVYLSDFLADAPREMIVEIFVQLARALDYIHTLGLVHEDIKPTNVLVTKRADGQAQAKLIDFGLARMLRTPDAEEKEPDLDDESAIVVLGTPGFSAPEKVRGQGTDSRSDIYSLAATIYTATRGQRPFPSRNFKEALRAQRDWRPELAGALLSTCGPVVAELVGRMLQPEPKDRPQSARSIVLELLRRESTHMRDREESREDRREFARVLVEHLPFVDRGGALELLLTRASDILMPNNEGSGESSRSGARSRLIRTIIVEAPEGMGKQRLIGELRREIQIGGGLIVEASCWHSESTNLGPFGPIIRQLVTALGDRSEVVGRFADLIKLARDKSGDSTASGQIIEFLLAAAEEKPYVLHLSDLAQAPAELGRIEQLCRAIDHSDAPLMMCATTVPHRKLAPLLAGLSKDQVAESWNLRPFSQREMHSILVGILGDGSSTGDLVEMLDKLTGGHPLSFRETLRVLIEESILVRETDGWVLRGASAAAEELHKTLAQRSESRLDSQGVSAWEVVSILYLLEAPIDERELADLVDVRKGRFERTLDRLEGEGLIVRTATSGSSQISLAHESVREAVRRRYTDSLDETRVDLAASIEDLESEDPHFIYLRARRSVVRGRSGAARRPGHRAPDPAAPPIRRHGGAREAPTRQAQATATGRGRDG